ncbi:MAG TPA: PilZ domain-containing protein [Thermoanaerobaculia bacterium]
MYEASARNLRTVERFLLAPPLPANFGTTPVSICDISARGARFRHDHPFETGKKGVLRVAMEGRPAPVNLEAVIVWSERDLASPGKFVSGVRTYGSPDVVEGLIAQLQTSHRSNRIEELRAADRFYVMPSLEAKFGDANVRLENLSARGARIEISSQPTVGTSAPLAFRVLDDTHDVVVSATVVWTSMRSISGKNIASYRAGLVVPTKHELMRLAIAQLCEADRATLDTNSLLLKLKILRARARQLAPSFRAVDAGIPSEQYLLVQGVREELRLNPDEAMHWYRRARLVINDPSTRSTAPSIVDHPDALAVWEYLDRSLDPTIVGRAFGIA